MVEVFENLLEMTACLTLSWKCRWTTALYGDRSAAVDDSDDATVRREDMVIITVEYQNYIASVVEK